MSDAAVGMLLAAGMAWVLLGVAGGAAIGKGRGREAAGFLLGLVLGPLGWLVVVLLPRAADAQARYELEVERHKAELERRRHRGGGAEK